MGVLGTSPSSLSKRWLKSWKVSESRFSMLTSDDVAVCRVEFLAKKHSEVFQFKTPVGIKDTWDPSGFCAMFPSFGSRQTKTITEIFHFLSRSRKPRSQKLQQGRAKTRVLSVPYISMVSYFQRHQCWVETLCNRVQGWWCVSKLEKLTCIHALRRS